MESPRPTTVMLVATRPPGVASRARSPTIMARGGAVAATVGTLEGTPLDDVAARDHREPHARRLAACHPPGAAPVTHRGGGGHRDLVVVPVAGREGPQRHHH